MANDLTGDFDVVAEFTLGAANRVLAAMHSGVRFPHSWSLRVDDTFHAKRTARSLVDVFGDPLIDPVSAHALAPTPAPLRRSASDPVFQQVDPLVNVGDPHAPGPADRAHLRGIAQLQFGPPTLTVPDDSGSSVVTHTSLMARYFPDPGTMEVPEYLRGEIQITLGAEEVFSQAGTFIDVRLVGLGGNIQFLTNWSSVPLSAQQQTAINKAFRNSLINSFQPSSTPLPTGILNMQFKTMPQDSQALAILMSLPGGSYAAGQAVGEGIFGLQPGPGPDPADVNDIFLGDGDDFALAVSSDFFTAPFTSAINAAIDATGLRQGQLSIPGGSLNFLGVPVESATVRGEFSIGDATVELRDSVFGSLPGGAAADAALAAQRHGTGEILLEIPVHVHVNIHYEGPFSPDDTNLNFDIVLSQAFDLDLENGAVTGLNLLFDLAISGVSGNLAAAFKSQAQLVFNTIWNNQRDRVNQQVAGMLSTDKLTNFFDPLTNPPSKSAAQPVSKVPLQLAYTTFEIRSTGVILHGTLQVPAWPPAVVDFASRSFSVSTPAHSYTGTEYSALKSWIPGGTITEFVWNLRDGPALRDDHDTFVLPNPQTGLRHLCLTVKGTRISATDPLGQEDVSRTLCAWSVPTSVAGGLLNSGSGTTGRPKIALTQFADSGALEVIGHTSLGASSATGSTNLIVHFPDNHSLLHLDFLTRALLESGRTDTATEIVAVLTASEFAKVRPVDGIMLSDDGQTWSHLLGVKSRPATYVLGTTGEVVWHHQGQLTAADLAGALKTHLLAGGDSVPRLLQATLRIGKPTPNFLFESSPGRQLTLRKLSGRRAVLVFWTTTSLPSLGALLDLQKAFAAAGAQGPILLAINDGEMSELAKRVAAEHGVSAIVVPDPRQEISSAYGVSIWPTSVFLDDQGLVSDIRYGRFSAELTRRPSPANAAD